MHEPVAVIGDVRAPYIGRGNPRLWRRSQPAAPAGQQTPGPIGYRGDMTSRLLALTITAAVALGVAGSASAGGFPGGFLPPPDNSGSANVTGTWDKTHTYGVNGKRRTCTLTRGAKCVGAKLRGRVKHHGDLRKANLRKADLRHCDLRGANLSGADLRGANLRFCDLRGANLRGARLHHHPGTRPTRVQIATASNPFWDPGPTPPCVTAPQGCKGANLAGANLAYSNLNAVNLSNANLSGANLSGAMSEEATWTDTNMTNVKAINVELSDSDLTRANLAGAELSGAVFNSSILSAANLANADLAGANFGGSNLTLANLRNAHVTAATAWPEVTWSSTVCPDGTVTNTGCPT